MIPSLARDANKVAGVVFHSVKQKGPGIYVHLQNNPLCQWIILMKNEQQQQLDHTVVLAVIVAGTAADRVKRWR